MNASRFLARAVMPVAAVACLATAGCSAPAADGISDGGTTADGAASGDARAEDPASTKVIRFGALRIRSAGATAETGAIIEGPFEVFSWNKETGVVERIDVTPDDSGVIRIAGMANESLLVRAGWRLTVAHAKEVDIQPVLYGRENVSGFKSDQLALLDTEEDFFDEPDWVGIYSPDAYVGLLHHSTSIIAGQYPYPYGTGVIDMVYGDMGWVYGQIEVEGEGGVYVGATNQAGLVQSFIPDGLPRIICDPQPVELDSTITAVLDASKIPEQLYDSKGLQAKIRVMTQPGTMSQGMLGHYGIELATLRVSSAGPFPPLTERQLSFGRVGPEEWEVYGTAAVWDSIDLDVGDGRSTRTHALAWSTRTLEDFDEEAFDPLVSPPKNIKVNYQLSSEPRTLSWEAPDKGVPDHYQIEIFLLGNVYATYIGRAETDEEEIAFPPGFLAALLSEYPGSSRKLVFRVAATIGNDDFARHPLKESFPNSGAAALSDVVSVP